MTLRIELLVGWETATDQECDVTAISRISCIRSAYLACGLLLSAISVSLTLPAAADEFLEGQMAAHDGNHEAALRAWLPLARDGHIKAQYAVGSLFAEGRGAPQDLSAAFDWWLLAAKQSHVRAQFNVAVMYKNGVGVDRNEGEAVRWISVAAAQDDRDAQLQLSEFYRVGCGVGQDPVKAYTWLEIARLGGHPSVSSKIDAIGAVLTDAQIAEAQKRATSWVESRQFN